MEVMQSRVDTGSQEFNENRENYKRLVADLREKLNWARNDRDKKAVDKWPKFVLISRFGQVHQVDGQWAVDVGQQIVNSVLDSLY